MAKMKLEDMPTYLKSLPLVDLAQLADSCSFSRWHFHRSFVRKFGETPLELLTRQRILTAQSLLRRTDLSVTEICFEVGFESLGTFSSRFSKLVGQSPTEYRKASRRPVPFCLARGWAD